MLFLTEKSKAEERWSRMRATSANKHTGKTAIIEPLRLLATLVGQATGQQIFVQEAGLYKRTLVVPVRRGAVIISLTSAPLYLAQ